MIFTGHDDGVLRLWHLAPRGVRATQLDGPPNDGGDVEDAGNVSTAGGEDGALRPLASGADSQMDTRESSDMLRDVVVPNKCPGCDECEDERMPMELEVMGSWDAFTDEVLGPNSDSQRAGLSAISVAVDGSAVYCGDTAGRLFRWDNGRKARSSRWMLRSSSSSWI